jgi:hypothetical protein
VAEGRQITVGSNTSVTSKGTAEAAERRFFWRGNLVRALQDLLDVRLAIPKAQRILTLLSSTPVDQSAVPRRYGAYLAMAIRLQRDTGTASRSLAATLLDMANNPTTARSFSGEPIDVHALREDRCTLECASADIASFATHAVAHTTDVQAQPVSFDTLHEAVETFRSIVQKYSALLMGVTLMDRGEELLPT